MTKKEYELYLNDTITEAGHHWTIGGKYRRYYMIISKYGTALRKYDSIAFEVGYNDYKRK